VTSTSDSATTPKRPEASLGELFSEMTSELSTLFRQEVQLAKAEAREDARRATRAGAKLAVAGVAALLAAVMISFCVAWLLDQAINRALAFLIVGVIWAGAALALFLSGRQNLKDVEGLPTTRETIKEDVEWAKAQKS
jgi:cobalamin biosynthesis protein CobD/CbiB